MVLCTTTGSGGSRMSRRLDPDEPAVEAVGPPVGSVIGPSGVWPAGGGRGWRWGRGGWLAGQRPKVKGPNMAREGGE